MPSLDKPDPGDPSQPPATVQWRMPSVHPEGRKFMVAAAAVMLLFFLVLDWETFGWLTAGVLVWLGVFFRDPVRTTPVAPGLVTAPADGLVTEIATVLPPPELTGEGALPDTPTVRITIHMSLFDGHIIRTPIEGSVRRLAHNPGRPGTTPFTTGPDEADSERQHMLVESPDGTRVGITQVAAFVSRRIQVWVDEGARVVPGQRIGLIRFGSRIHVYLPPATSSQVLLGQRTVAGETIIAKAGQSALIEGVAQ